MLVVRAPRRPATTPMDLDCVVWRAGARIAESSLWPDTDAPRIPVLIECTISPRSRAGVCAFKGECLYVVWRYERKEFVEAGRFFSMQGEWWDSVYPLVVRELARSNTEPKAPDLSRISSETGAFIEERLKGLTDAERVQILATVYEQMVRRFAACGVAGIRLRAG